MLFGINPVFGAEGTDTGSLIGWIGGATALLVALGQVFVMIWNSIYEKRQKAKQAEHTNRQEELKTQQEVDTRAIKQWIEVCERLQRQVDRLDGHTKDQAEAISFLRAEHADCQAEVSNLYAYIDYIYDVSSRILKVAIKLGLEGDNHLPPKPVRKQKENKIATEFKVRTLQQRQETLEQKTQEVIEQTPSTPNLETESVDDKE